MPIRTKTKKRLLILLAVFFTVVALGGGLYWVRYGAKEREAREAKALGLSQVAKGQYHEAMSSLQKCLLFNGNDLEALRALAQARPHVEEPNGAHIAQTIGLFRRILVLDPTDDSSRRELMELYVKVGWATDALQTADQILDHNPENVEALRAKTIALLGLRRFDEALAVVRKLGALRHDDVDAAFLLLTVLRAKDTPPPALMAEADRLLASQPDSPRLLLVKGYAHYLNRQFPEALACYRTVAQTPTLDLDTTRQLVSLLDSVGQYAEALAVLSKQAPALGDASLRLQLARRQLQAEQLTDLLKLTDDQRPETDSSDSQLLALRVLALLRLERPVEAEALFQALEKRREDNAAAAWAPYLAQFFAKSPPTIAQRLRIAQECLSRDPANPFLRMALAEAYVAQGEYPLALQALRTLAQYAPTWHLPFLRLATLLADQNQLDQALAMAAEACQRAPRNLPAALTLAEIRLRTLRDEDAKATRDLLQFVEEICKAAPSATRPAVLRLAILARMGDLQAVRDGVQTMLQATPAPDSEGLLRLLVLSQQYHLDLEETVLDAAQRQHGMTPDIALQRANALALRGKVDEGRQLLEKTEHPSEQGVAWQIAMARYLERFVPAEAAQAWTQLGDAHPQDAQMQQLLLQSSALWRERSLVRRAIDRVQQLLGDSSLSGKFYRARWLLEGNPDPKEIAEAVTFLNDVARADMQNVQVRLMLASALEQAHNVQTALGHLEAAAALRPDAGGIMLHIALLQQTQGDMARARATLARLPAQATLSPEETRRAAGLWLALGDPASAIALLERGSMRGVADVDNVLAVLYMQTGRLDKAEELVQKLLEHPSPEAIDITAHFYAATARMDKAHQVLDQLDQLEKAPPRGAKEIIRGYFAARYEDHARAVALFRQAAGLDPQNPRAWNALLSLLIQDGQADDLLTAAADAARALPGEGGYRALSDNKELIRAGLAMPVARGMVRVAALSATYRAVALDALRALGDPVAQPQPLTRSLDRIRPLADLHPQLFELQVLAVQLASMAERREEAIELSGRTMEVFPASVEAAELTTAVYAAASRWAEALNAAREWRRRSVGDPGAADMAIAEAQIRLGHPESALTQANPSLFKALSDPDQNVLVILTNARALVAAGDFTRAQELLRPLLSKGPLWRQAWVRIAALMIRDRDEATGWLREAAGGAQTAESRAELGGAWHQLYLQFNKPADLEQAQQLYRAAADDPQAQPPTVLSAAMFFQNTGDAARAEACYRRRLLTGELPVAQNNLAMLLLENKGDAAEALKLAEKASRSTGDREPAFLDTVAQAHRALGHAAQAVDFLRQAAALEPYQPKWLLHLGEAQLADGQKDAARATLAEFNRLFPDAQTLHADLRDEIDRFRRQLEGR
jgi:Flp pilus assembly protein TadD/Tfp pilus assembly protein PilF